jgi:chorismate mutase
MAPDLLSTIRHEIDERLSELRPLLAERERLLVAVEALEAAGSQADTDTVSESAAPKRVVKPRTAKPLPAKPARRGRPAIRRGSAAGAIELAAAGPADASTEEHEVEEPAVKGKSQRAARGVARETILAALDHGSHTVSELAVVTAMSAPNINGNLRKLVAEGAIVKTEREGKAAWALPDAA